MAAKGKPTNFLHLSDIHFRPKDGFDADGHLRTAIEKDIPVLRKALGGIMGILVTGDIAYRGGVEEFRNAGNWLDKLCELAGCRPDQVWTTPGNHDVDRLFVKREKTVQDFYERVRQRACQRGPGQVDVEVNAALKDKLGLLMLESIRPYNDFAVRYGCDVSPAKPYWEQDIPLNDGSVLKIWGLTSTLISDENDHQDGGRLAIGSCQLDLPQQHGIETMTLCHHPLPWLLDQDNVDKRLMAGARVQLFGHKHSQCIRRIDNTIRIIAGAVHPDRHEREWTPRYNAISFHVAKNGRGRNLTVSTHLRIWNEEKQQFVADTVSAAPAGCRPEMFNLEPWSEGGKTARAAAAEISSNDKKRQLRYRFHTLDYPARCAALEKVGVAMPTGTADLEFFHRNILALEKAKRLHALWEAINVVTEDPQMNPFKARGE